MLLRNAAASLSTRPLFCRCLSSYLFSGNSSPWTRLTSPEIPVIAAAPESAAGSPERLVGTAGLRKFVENITRKPKEARLWLKYFKYFSAKSPGRAFAVMRLSPDVFADTRELRRLAWSTAFLFEHGLVSALICRMSGDEDWQRAELLGQLLLRHGVPSKVLLMSGLSEDSVSGQQGADLLSLSQVCVPIVCCPVLASDAGDEAASAAVVDSALMRLCEVLRPLKVLLLSGQPGLPDPKGRVMSDVVLPSDLAPLTGPRSHLNAEQRRQLLTSAELLGNLSSESHVVLTSAGCVVQELFTHHGSGTMVRTSEKIIQQCTLKSVSRPAMSALFNRAFGKTLREDWYTRAEGLVESVYFSESYSAAAVVLRLPNVRVPYLDKIAVSEAAQGSGIAVMLWNRVMEDYPRLFWRAKCTNKAAVAWYNTLAQGSWKADRDWTIFWYGLSDSGLLGGLIDYASKKPADFY